MLFCSRICVVKSNLPNLAELNLASRIMIRLLIADDHTIMREGLKRILEGEANIQIVAEAVDGLDALQKVRAGGIDLILLDLSMPGRSGVDLIRQIREEFPK